MFVYFPCAYALGRLAIGELGNAGLSQFEGIRDETITREKYLDQVGGPTWVLILDFTWAASGV